MRLLLMRHGAAVDPTVAGDDHRRWLTEVGREQLREQGARLTARGLTPGAVLSSPLVRAVQTAELIVSACRCQAPVRVASELHPSLGTTLDAVDALRMTGASTVLAVGHEPLIRVLASHLSGLELPPFRTSMICKIEWSGHGVGVCEWLMEPSRGELIVPQP